MWPKDVVDVEIKFNPKESNTFYWGTLYGRAFLYEDQKEAKIIKDDGVVYFPIPIEMSFIGIL